MSESSDNQEGVYATIAGITYSATRSRSPIRLTAAAGASRIRSHSPEAAIPSVPKRKREYQKRMKIFIYTLSGENTMLYMKPRETIKRLKAVIQEIKNIV